MKKKFAKDQIKTNYQRGLRFLSRKLLVITDLAQPAFHRCPNSDAD